MEVVLQSGVAVMAILPREMLNIQPVKQQDETQERCAASHPTISCDVKARKTQKKRRKLWGKVQ